MSARFQRVGGLLALLLGFSVLSATVALGLPAAGPLAFVGATPHKNSLVTIGAVNVQLSAECTVDTATLAVSINGVAIPAADFLPFSACANGRMTSQVATVNVTLPDTSITGGPSSLSAGQNGTFAGSGSGDGLSWNFDGGAAPGTGSPVTATFEAAGSFTVRARATVQEDLEASALDDGNLVTAQRGFKAGDPTPATHQLAVIMPPDVDFENFESSQVHPLALSEAGDQLYAVNTPEDRLAIFDIETDGSLTLAGNVEVGLGPVSVAVRPGTDEVWVANHLSDTVSIVDVAAGDVTGTIACGDEPTDVAFASGRAFVSLAGKQDKVNVYDAATRGQIASLDIFGDDPRALAVNAAGTEVYAVVLESGNQTTTLFHDLVSDGGGPPPPNPPRKASLGAAPNVGLVVKFNPANGRWEDETGGNWSNYVDFSLPDEDLFVISANAPTPSVVSTVSHLGTLLFDVEVQPGTGDVWVPNTDARNLVRFEPNLRGHLVQTRVSIVDPSSGGVTPVDLNPHINYAVTPGSPQEIAASLASPGDGVFSADGSTFYLTAFGSRKVGVLDAFGAVTDLIDVGNGPSGVALNEADGRLYVLNRIDNTISTVDTGTNTQIAVTGVAGPSQFDPTPDVIKNGRKFLYDAQLTSGHGDVACATCHMSANFDNIAWDFGDPLGDFVNYSDAPFVQFGPILGPSTDGFDPMKGPMTTQTLRGLQGLEPFHWRGDMQDFQHFNGAFASLMGLQGFCEVSMQACVRHSDCPSGELCLGISATDMDAYTDFIMTVRFPPNPYDNLNDTLPSSLPVPLQTGGGAMGTGNPQNGRSGYINELFDAGAISCNGCHTLPTGSNNKLFNGNAEQETQDFKIPQLRNMYEKIGFDLIRPGLQSGNASNIALPQQKRGFGFLHDGSVSLTEFLAAPVFTMSAQQQRDMYAFMLAFPTETPPVVGHQVTLTTANQADAGTINEINALTNHAINGKSDVVAKGVIGGVKKGYYFDPEQQLFLPDSLTETPLSSSDLRLSVGSGDVLVYTGVPLGAGRRLGIDRDRDTWLDRSEEALGYDPADPNSNPWQNQ
jgi:YVTN family beta-propeller protein